jgi:hypothetical protein
MEETTSELVGGIDKCFEQAFVSTIVSALRPGNKSLLIPYIHAPVPSIRTDRLQLFQVSVACPPFSDDDQSSH